MQNKTTFKHIVGYLKMICVVICVALTSSVSAQTTVSTASGTNYNGDYSLNNPAALMVSFSITNNTAAPMALTSVSTQMAPYFSVIAGSTSNNKLYASTTSLGGAFDVSTAAWTQVATGTATVPAALAVTEVINSANYIINAGATVRFAIECSTGLAFSFNPTPTPNNFTTAGIKLSVGDAAGTGGNIGYAGVSPAPAVGNTPAFFGGSVTLTSTVPCAGTPNPGNTISSTGATVCASSPLVLSAQNATPGSGVTYVWEDSSATTSAAWVAAGSTASTLTTSQTIPTSYRVKVTCSGVTTISNPVAVGITPLSGCYCDAGATNTSTSFEKIDNVTFGTLNNSSTSFAGYENFTTLTPIPSFIVGSVNPITITGNANTYDGDVVAVWIDYNHNGNFSDPGEQVYLSAESAGPYTGNITIPADATLGNTRMRIRIFDDIFGNGVSGPCGNADYGQVEDYTINIAPCVPLTFTSPVATSTTCGGTATFTVATSGSLASVSWQYRSSASAPNWQTVTNGGIYSGATTNSLTITNAIDSYNGYQYRAVVTGVCTGLDVTAPATLTVNQLVPVISPASATICNGSIQALTLTNTLNNTDLLSEGFATTTTATPLPTGWALKNNSTGAASALSTWFKGNPDVFSANSGDPDSYIGANYNATTGASTISDWLFTPVVSMKNGDVFTFYTRASGNYADRIEVRQSSNGASVDVGATATSLGDFTNLLLTINPSLVTTGATAYPIVWTKFTVTVSGLAAPTTGRMAFRYYVTSGGPSGANSDYLGIDDVAYTSTGGAAQGVWTTQTTPATMFTDAAATIPYVAGSLANKIWVKPTATTTYSVTYQTLSPCTSKVGSATVTVTQPVSGSSTVANQITCAGGTVTFTASAPTGGSPLLQQWYVSTDNGATYTKITNTGVYSGATTSALKVTGATLAMNNYKYKDSLYVTVCGTYVISNTATLTVNPNPTIVLSAAPYTKLYPGLTTTITAAVSPNPASTYSWFRNGVAVPNVTGNKIVVDVDHLGSYTVTVNDVNTCSSTSSAISISDSSNSTLFIYPSPSTGQFQVRYYTNLAASPTHTSPGFVNVYDSKGARVWSKAYTVLNGYTRMDVDLTNYSKGIYRIDLVDTKGNRIKTGSVVIF